MKTKLNALSAWLDRHALLLGAALAAALSLLLALYNVGGGPLGNLNDIGGWRNRALYIALTAAVQLFVLLMAALLRSEGATMFVENMFESRYRHVPELLRLGADIRLEGRVAVVCGVPELHAAAVCSTDLRGGAALAVAALQARGITQIHDIHHIQRGYEDLTGDLRSLGAEIAAVEGSEI